MHHLRFYPHSSWTNILSLPENRQTSFVLFLNMNLQNLYYPSDSVMHRIPLPFPKVAVCSSRMWGQFKNTRDQVVQEPRGSPLRKLFRTMRLENEARCLGQLENRIGNLKQKSNWIKIQCAEYFFVGKIAMILSIYKDICLGSFSWLSYLKMTGYDQYAYF